MSVVQEYIQLRSDLVSAYHRFDLAFLSGGQDQVGQAQSDIIAARCALYDLIWATMDADQRQDLREKIAKVRRGPAF